MYSLNYNAIKPEFQNIIRDITQTALDITQTQEFDLERRLSMAVVAKSIISVFLHEMGMTSIDIAKFFNNDHSTILYRIKQHNYRVRCERFYMNYYNNFVDKINDKGLNFINLQIQPETNRLATHNNAVKKYTLLDFYTNKVAN